MSDSEAGRKGRGRQQLGAEATERPTQWPTSCYILCGQQYGAIGGKTVWCLQNGWWGVALCCCQVVTLDATLPTRRKWLCIEDDLGDLSVLHGSAVVVSRRVAEGEARLCASGRRLVRYLSHSFCTIMGVWTLCNRGKGGGGSITCRNRPRAVDVWCDATHTFSVAQAV